MNKAKIAFITFQNTTMNVMCKNMTSSMNFGFCFWNWTWCNDLKQKSKYVLESMFLQYFVKYIFIHFCIVLLVALQELTSLQWNDQVWVHFSAQIQLLADNTQINACSNWGPCGCSDSGCDLPKGKPGHITSNVTHLEWTIHERSNACSCIQSI